jgi:hypothetical protein
MIAKQIKGRGFRGCLKYLLGQKDSQIIGGNMIGQDPDSLTREFNLSRRLNANVKRVVYHACLSTPLDEKLTDDTWTAFVADYLVGMGFDQNQYVIVKHLPDRQHNHNHIHVVASRIKMDGKCVHDSWDYPRSEKLLRELEQNYQLTTPEIKNPLKRSPTTGEVRLRRRTGEPSIRQQIQDTIDIITSTPLSLEEFINQLARSQIDVQIHQTRTGLISGISYEYQGVAFSGSHLGSGYTLGGLEKYHGVNYEKLASKQIQPLLVTEPIKRYIQSQIRDITDPYIKEKLDRSLPLPEFLQQLEERGIKADVRYTRNGCVRGINYKYEGAKFTGGDLGCSYTFGGLQKHRKISYDPAGISLRRVRSQDAEIKSGEYRSKDLPTRTQVSHDNQDNFKEKVSTDVTTATSKESDRELSLSSTPDSTEDRNPRSEELAAEIVTSDNLTKTTSINPHREKKPIARSPNTAMSTSESKENENTIDTDRKSENASPSPVTKIDPTIPFFGEAWLREELKKELQQEREIQQQQSKQEKKRGFGR